MKQRLISAFCGIIVLILVLLGNQTVFDVVVTLISSMAVYEVLAAVGLKEKKTFTAFSVLMPIVLMFASYFFEAYMLTVVFVFLAVYLLIMLFNHTRYSFSDVATAFASAVMVSVPFLFVTPL